MAIHPRSGGWGVWARGAAAQTAGAELRGGELAGAGCFGAPVGHLGCGLVQKDERDTRKSLEHVGWRFCALAGLATVRGGPGSPAWHGRALPASV